MLTAAYWLGVATPFAVALALGLVALAVRAVATSLADRGWFFETGAAPGPEVTFHSRLTARSRFGIRLGLYRTTAGWGSRWLALGPLVTIGRKSTALALTEKPPVAERTRRTR